MRVVRALIALFDIDGTLVSCGGAGRRSMERAFLDVVGRSDVADFGFGGMTDRAIARIGLSAGGALDRGDEHDERTIDAFLERYLGFLAEEVPRSPMYRVLPGVLEILDAMSARERVVVGLGTGNLVRGARIKLDRAGIYERFRFGGFGSDHEDRASLLAIGAARGAEEVDHRLDECDVVVIGDTPRDVIAARAIGARCVAVATGGYDEDELSAAGADVVFADLTHDDVLAAIVGR